MNLWVTIYAIGAAQAVLLALALWRRSVNPQANRVLAAWLAIVGLDLAVKAVNLAAPAPLLYRADRLVALFPFLYGSFFYLYVRALTTARGFALRDVIHLAGFLLMVAMTAPWFLLGPEHTAVPFKPWFVDALALPPWWFDFALFGYSLSYVVAALVRVQRHRRQRRQRRSDADRLSLRWIVTLAIGQIVIWCIAAAHVLVRIPYVDYHLIYGAVAAWVCVIGWFSLGQPPVVDEPPEQNSEAAGGDAPVDDARDDDTRFPAVEARLHELMSGEKIYCEPALTIGQVAKRSGYPEYLVSAVINRRMSENFWEYINRHRIDAACACLADRDDGRTILEIAYACGFTSKSTFNAAFKRQTGKTPSIHRRRHAAPSMATPSQH